MKVAVITNIIPHYRFDYYKQLFERNDVDFHIFCQNELAGSGIKTCHSDFSDRVTVVSALMARSGITWQSLPIRELLTAYDVYLFLGDPRVLSTVFLATFLKVLGRSVVIHGHGHTAGANKFTEKARLMWWRLFDYVLVYTDREADLLRMKGFDGKKHVLGMNNGLNQQKIDSVVAQWTPDHLKNWQAQAGIFDARIILSVARLVEKNRFDMMLDILPVLIREYPNLLWCVIGNGPLRNRLEDRAHRLGVEAHIRLLGAIHNEEDLAPWFLSSDVLVNPGAIGLTLLHGFGYGLPVITHDNLSNQMPEIAALINHPSGFVFKENDSVSLIETIETVLNTDSELRVLMGEFALRTVRTQYNIDVMARRTLEIIQLSYARKG